MDKPKLPELFLYTGLGLASLLVAGLGLSWGNPSWVIGFNIVMGIWNALNAHAWNHRMSKYEGWVQGQSEQEKVA